MLLLDPDIAAARIAAQQTIAQRLQDKYNKDATEYQQKMEEVCVLLR